MYVISFSETIASNIVQTIVKSKKQADILFNILAKNVEYACLTTLGGRIIKHHHNPSSTEE